MTNISMGQYLTGLAESVRQAQRQISRKNIQGRFGLPDTLYQMPKVDFDLKLWFNATVDNDSSKEPNLWVNPVHAYCNYPETASIIKGSFIAASAKKGVPDAVFETAIAEADGNLDVSVTVASFDKQPIICADVKFDIDPEMSLKLSGSSYSIEQGTKFSAYVVKTDDLGIAQNTLEIDPNQPAGSYIAIIVDVSGEIETVVYKK